LHRDAVVLLLPDPNRIELAPAQIESLALGLNSPIHIFYFPLHIEVCSSQLCPSQIIFLVRSNPCFPCFLARIIRAHLLSIWVQMPLEWSATRATDRDCSCCLQFPLSSISPVFFFNFLFLPVMPIDMCSNEFCLTTFYLASFASFGSAQIKCCWLGTVFFLGYISYHYFLPWRVGIELQV